MIGAGNYATSMLLPHLRGRPDVQLVEVATATGLSAANAQRRFGFERCSTDHRGLLADETIDAVVIATRHHAHAAMVCEALAAGKAVFVEKPLAVDSDQLRAILAAVADSGNDRLMVGFNRRFAPLLVDLKAAAGTRSGPVQVRYDVNAGRLEAGSWYGQPEEGSRLVGEGCHFVDTISWWLDQDPVAVFSAATGDPDDTASTLLYPDGSVATIAYQTGGDPRAPKELFQVSGDGQVARLLNFQRTELWRGGRRHVRRSRTGIDKGQRQELDAFVRAVAEARPCRSRWPRWWRRRWPPSPPGAAWAATAWKPWPDERRRRRVNLAVVCPAPGPHVAGGDGRAGARRADQAPLAASPGHRRRRRPDRRAGRLSRLRRPASGGRRRRSRGRPGPAQGGRRGPPRRPLAGVRPRARRHGARAGLVPGRGHRPSSARPDLLLRRRPPRHQRQSATSSTCGSRPATST